MRIDSNYLSSLFGSNLENSDGGIGFELGL
jgi:hypothetical protein